MGRSPCCDNSSGLKKGPWTPEEDEKLTAYIQEHGYGSWRALPKLAGLNRCGKSCRLRWTNYLRPDIKRGKFADDEEALIIKLHSVLGNKWSRIATHLPGRTDNEIKNFWNTHIRKKLLQMGIDPITHKPRTDLNLLANLSHLLSTQNLTSTSGSMTMNQPPPTTTTNLANWDNMNALRLQSDATQLAKLQILSNIFQILNTNTSNSSPHLIPPPLLDQNTSHHHQLGGGGDGEGGFQNLLASASSNGLTTPTTTMDPISFLGEFSNSSAAAAAASSHAYPWGTGGSPTTTATAIDRAYRSFMSSSLADNNDQRAGPTENNVLPALVTFSPKQPSYSDAVQVEAISKSNTNSAYGSSACTDQSPSDDFFEGLDKLIDDDGTSGSFWKDFITN